MRSMVFFLFMLAVPVSYTIAQRQVSIGCKAGLSIPNLTGGSKNTPVSKGYSSRLDANAAVHIEFQVTNRFSIQPQLEYSSQGGKKNGTQAFTVPAEMIQLFPPGQAPAYLYATYKSKARINYLMLPLLAKYHFAFHKKWGLYVAAGPFASMLLHAVNITSGSSMIYLDEAETQPLMPTAQSFDNKDVVTSDLHRFNAGISGHIGLEFQLSRGQLLFEAGGNYGLIDIQKDDANGKNKTGAAAITLGYQFHCLHK